MLIHSELDIVALRSGFLEKVCFLSGILSLAQRKWKQVKKKKKNHSRVVIFLWRLKKKKKKKSSIYVE